MTVRIAALGPDELECREGELLRIYRETFSGPPYNERAEDVVVFLDRMWRHSTYPGFRFRGAIGNGGELLGFAYGYSSRPGQWWHDVVRRAMPPEVRADWLGDAFDFTEIAVRPDARGRGLGDHLHDALLEGIAHRTACLSTHQSESVALRLYRGRGWEDVLRDFHFPGFAQPYLILGKRLRPREDA